MDLLVADSAVDDIDSNDNKDENKYSVFLEEFDDSFTNARVSFHKKESQGSAVLQ